MLNQNNFLTSFKTNNMKHTLFLSDFLLIRDSLDEKLLDKTIDAYADMRKQISNGNTHWTNKFQLTLALNELVDSLQDPNVHFQDHDHKVESIYEVVRMLNDVYTNGTGYVIKRVHVPNQKNPQTTENE